MNKLYGLLTVSVEPIAADNYYKKLHMPVQHTPKSGQLCAELLKDVPTRRIPLFACFVCFESLETVFGEEIQKWDTNNTYSRIVKDPNSSPEDGYLLLWDLTQSASSMKHIYRWLDKDITDRLVVPEWLDIISAACLQMLRETA